MSSFSDQLQNYKLAVDDDIQSYSTHVRKSTQTHYGTYPTLVTEAFLDMLGRGGKRIRGALVMAGYEMCGGTDQAMIVRAATAMEMIHAYLLILDDIQDRSEVRRGRPTVHVMLAAYHRQHKLKGNAAHAGVSLALNAAMSGNNLAFTLLAGLQVAPQLAANAVGIVAHTIGVTAHGQTLDIMQELTGDVSQENIEHTMEWKTATYTVLNPLCVGMVLAGAGCEDTDAIRSYALHTGKAFQITDDIIGVFGTAKETGKDAMDDMREGKQTLLTMHAFSFAPPEDAAFLRACLGNNKLAVADFEACRRIIKECGALKFAEDEAQRHVRAALDSLAQAPAHWKTTQVAFLQELTQSLIHRTN